jgi:hypothetical protein
MAADTGQGPAVLVVGAGDLGLRVCRGLACGRTPMRLRLAGRNVDDTERKANLVRFTALQLGHTHEVDAVAADLDDVSRLAETIAEFDPDIVFMAATRQSWRVLTELPRAAFERLDAANFGPWLAMHLDPVHRLMTAVRDAGSRAVVVNAAFPDAVHPVLAKADLSPDVGIGNVANMVPALTLAAAERLGRPVSEVRTRFVAHHFVTHRVPRYGDSGGAAMSLTFTCDGRDVTGEVDIDAVLSALTTRYRRTGGTAGQMLTAASALSVLEPLVSGRSATAHAPGLDGLPGGYPVRVEDRKILVDLPPGMDLDEAAAINEHGQRFDGIDRIDPDGRAWFTEESVDIMRRELSFDRHSVHWSEARECADELADRFATHRRSLR